MFFAWIQSNPLEKKEPFDPYGSIKENPIVKELRRNDAKPKQQFQVIQTAFFYQRE